MITRRKAVEFSSRYCAFYKFVFLLVVFINCCLLSKELEYLE